MDGHTDVRMDIETGIIRSTWRSRHNKQEKLHVDW